MREIEAGLDKADPAAPAMWARSLLGLFPRSPRHDAGPAAARLPAGLGPWLVVVAVLAGGIRLLPFLLADRPPGNDSSMHLEYAAEYLRLGQPPGPAPHYQLGLTEWTQLPAGPMYFGLVAAFADRSPLELAALAALLGAIEALAVLLLAHRLFGRADAAVVSALVAAASPGTLELTVTGAYPNLVGLALMPAALAAWLGYWESPSGRSAALAALVVCGALGSHHLSALWLGLTLAGFLALELLARPRLALARALPVVGLALVLGLPQAAQARAVMARAIGDDLIAGLDRFAASRGDVVTGLVEPTALVLVAVLVGGLAAFFLLAEVSASGKRLIGCYTAVTVVLTFGWLAGVPFHYWRAQFFFGLPAAVAAGALPRLWAGARARGAVSGALVAALLGLGLATVGPIVAPRRLLTPGLEAGADWLRAHSRPGDVVLTSAGVGFHLARRVARPTLVALRPVDFFSSSAEANAAVADAMAILEGRDDGGHRLRARQVRFVVLRQHGPDFPDPERSRALFDAAAGFVRVFENDDLRVYEVQP